MKRIALIPAYMPDDKMITIVRQLYDAGFEIIIVNDGSSDDCIRVFEEASRYAKVLCHEKNQGKGKALKTGLEFINSNIEDSEVAVDTNTEVDRAKTSNPRTAIGVIDANHFVFVVSDGRTSESEGLSLYELANFMKDLGVTTAYNLDGGGSSTMYFNGYVINNPTSGGSIKERSVSDIVYI